MLESMDGGCQLHDWYARRCWVRRPCQTFSGENCAIEDRTITMICSINRYQAPDCSLDARR